MKLLLWSVGKQHEGYVKEGIADFTNRVSRYFGCEWKLISPPKNSASMPEPEQKDAESNLVLAGIEPRDFLVLLDERGKMLSSPELAKLLGERAINGTRRIVFVIGGAFGVSEPVRQRADLVWQLSKLVFPHQLVRLILAEQLYRACSILKNEKYHHQ